MNAASSRMGSARTANITHFATFIGASLTVRCWPRRPDRLRFG
jgi:hypothetical protein